MVRHDDIAVGACDGRPKFVDEDNAAFPGEVLSDGRDRSWLETSP